MGIVQVSSETAFQNSPEEVYDFVTDPRNWVEVYPGSEMIEGVERLPLEVGDIWHEAGDSPHRYSWRLVTAHRPWRWVFQSHGALAHDRENGTGGYTGIMTVSYSFLSPGEGVTVFHRSMTLEVPKGAELPPGLIRNFDPTYIDRYHAAVKKALNG
ncbi:SRPBCC family protein [Nocardia bovistercoris]|uniref:SRPBCC family protein n=1 Tax=Nocardia bovistercoris TaxID=2785916 RepID=A0A931N5U9_9NOCA|nr:SRPBCC family protein [Nocardia bovistercoris]